MVQINSDIDNDNDNKGSSKNDNNIKIDDALNLVAAHELSTIGRAASLAKWMLSPSNE